MDYEGGRRAGGIMREAEGRRAGWIMGEGEGQKGEGQEGL
jgi:hypothetical protein